MDDRSYGLIAAPPAPLNAPPPPDRRGVGRILLHLITHAEAYPLPPPEVSSDLAMLPAPQRIYESLRLAALETEFSLSQYGHLRALAKLACRIAVVVGIVSLCLGAVLACVSVVLAAIVTITGQLLTILWNLLEAALLLVALLAIGVVLLVAVRLLTRRADAGGQVRRRV